MFASAPVFQFVLHRIEGITRKEDYIKIIEENLKKDARKLGLGRKWWFQLDNDSKNKAKVVTEWLNKANINVLDWPLQSPDLNYIEKLWREQKVRVNARYTNNINELETVCKEEWSQIPSDICLNLVKNYNNRLADVIKQKGYAMVY